MNKYLKIALIIFLIILSVIILSPPIALLLPEKLASRTYNRFLYHVIVDRETADCKNEECGVLSLFQYVVDHQFLQGVPYKCKPVESLIYSEAWCDFQARTLNALLAVAGIRSRYAMLLDKDGNSPHTLNEVFLNGKWCIFDTAFNLIPNDASGNRLSLRDLSDNPDLIEYTKKLIALKTYDNAGYNSYIGFCHQVFPIPSEPRRSIPLIYQDHIFDYVVDTYFRLFKYKFFNIYQDLYLNLKKSKLIPEDFRLFYRARNYHLSYRWNLADKLYNIILKKYPEAKFKQDTIFFLGMLYFDKKDFSRAIGFLKLALSSKWKDAAYYYLGRSYEYIGNREAALEAYSNLDMHKLSTQILEELNTRGFKRRY